MTHGGWGGRATGVHTASGPPPRHGPLGVPGGEAWGGDMGGTVAGREDSGQPIKGSRWPELREPAK